jgi:NitT/TauT family transport system ATP-binding protein
MDEPFGALDEIVRDHLNEQLLKLWDKTNKTVVFVTHSIPKRCSVDQDRGDLPAPGPHLRRDRKRPAARPPLDIRETPEFLKIAHRVREGLRAGHSYDD